jgi:hypothetical protein
VKIAGLDLHPPRDQMIVEAISMMITLLARVAIGLVARIFPRPGMLDPLLICHMED